MQFNHKWGPPLSFTNMLSLKDYPYHLTKNESRTSKLPISQFFSELGKFGNAAKAFIKKKKQTIFHRFHELTKI